jgi:alpha-D-ribose 1-methylphosphonate 5-triphosphate synthase subunit PhnH
MHHLSPATLAAAAGRREPPVIELLRGFPTRWAEHGRAAGAEAQEDAVARQTFLGVLEAMTHPGRIVRLPARLNGRAAPMPASAALAQALLEDDSPVWLGPGIAAQAVLLRHRVCGHRLARFALVQAADAHPRLWHELGADSATGSAPGSADAQEGATLLIEVPGLLADPPPPRCEPGDLELMPRLQISAPGLLRQTRLAIDGLARHFWRERMNQQAGGRPATVEVLLVCADRIAAIPRCARVQLDD